MATYWENSCSFGLRYVSWYKYLIVSLVFSHLGFWSGNLFLIAPFPDLCLLVPFSKMNYGYYSVISKMGVRLFKYLFKFIESIHITNLCIRLTGIDCSSFHMSNFVANRFYEKKKIVQIGMTFDSSPKKMLFLALSRYRFIVSQSFIYQNKGLEITFNLIYTCLDKISTSK